MSVLSNFCVVTGSPFSSTKKMSRLGITASNATKASLTFGFEIFIGIDLNFFYFFSGLHQVEIDIFAGDLLVLDRIERDRLIKFCKLKFRLLADDHERVCLISDHERVVVFRPTAIAEWKTIDLSGRQMVLQIVDIFLAVRQ